MLNSGGKISACVCERETHQVVLVGVYVCVRERPGGPSQAGAGIHVPGNHLRGHNNLDGGCGAQEKADRAARKVICKVGSNLRGGLEGEWSCNAPRPTS